MEATEIIRGGQTIILPKEVLDSVYLGGRYLTLNKIKRSYGHYYQVMVCKKTNGKLVERSALARFILKAPPAIHVDHIDRNPLNNMPSNLRLVNASKNGANRKKTVGSKFTYKGVTKSKKRYSALCIKDGLRYAINSFATELEAAKAYDDLATMLYGNHAGLNFPKP